MSAKNHGNWITGDKLVTVMKMVTFLDTVYNNCMSLFVTDVNECELSMSDCAPSDDCVNTEGSFECLPRCAEGFRRSTDSMNCLGLLTSSLTY